MSKYVIGLNSGTSFDGIDVALVKFKKNDLRPTFIDGLVYEYPRIVKEKIRQLIDGVGARRGTPLREISQLNFLLGELFADAANKIIKKNKLQSKDILLIGSHGQTIYHDPARSTLQIGESSVIAQKTGIKTISNFREADIAAGGEGAPLISFLDWMVFGKGAPRRALLNIGGISNVTVVGKSIKPIAFDIGPGNALIDLLTQKYFKKSFDKDGKLAKRGKIFYKLIDRALKDLYFRKKPPKSTGKEHFNSNFIKKYFSPIETIPAKGPASTRRLGEARQGQHELSLLATITYFTAKTIEKAFHDFIFKKYPVKEIVISGGGVKNNTLIAHLRKLFSVGAYRGMPKITTSDKYGLPWKFKEAMLFALLGYTCYKNIPNNIPSCTGAKKKVILGKMTQGE